MQKLTLSRRNAGRHGFTLVEIMIVVAIIGLLAALAIPSFVQSVASTRTNACINNLRLVDYAQQQAMLVNNTSAPVASQVNSFLNSADPVCPSTDQPYVLTTAPPVCPSVASHPEHVLQ